MNLKLCTWFWCCLKILVIIFQHWKIFRVINLSVIHVACSFLWLWRVYFYAIFGVLFCYVSYSVLIVVWMSDCWIYLQLFLIVFIFIFWIEAFHIPFSINLKSCKLCLTVQCSFDFFFSIFFFSFSIFFGAFQIIQWLLPC